MSAASRQLPRNAIALILVCAAAIALGTAAHHFKQARSPAGMPREFSLEEFRGFVTARRGLVLDVRAREAYALGHVPGALSFPGAYFEGSWLAMKDRLEADRPRPVVVYCPGPQCGASRSVAEQLARRGFTNVAVFPGGWQAWQQAGLPVER
jgi:rhodanese-related sulfurtransferase